jgi:hypothetical protein
MYFPLLKFFKYENFDALPQLGNNHNLDPKSIISCQKLTYFNKRMYFLKKKIGKEERKINKKGRHIFMTNPRN